MRPFSQLRWMFLTLLLVWSLGHASVHGDEKPGENAADKVRKALDEVVTLDYSSQSFHDLVQHLKDKTHVNFILDVYALQQMGLGLEENPTPLKIKADKIKLRQALQRLLNPYHLSFVILDDAVLITSEDMGLHRQLRQRVTVDVKNMSVESSLKMLARTTSLNVVLDPRSAKAAQQEITLKLEDATLETAVRLLAELGGLKSVRMGNVLFITDEARAGKIRKEEPPPPATAIPLSTELILPGAGAFVPGAAPPIVLPNANPPRIHAPVEPRNGVPTGCEPDTK